MCVARTHSIFTAIIQYQMYEKNAHAEFDFLKRLFTYREFSIQFGRLGSLLHWQLVFGFLLPS